MSLQALTLSKIVGILGKIIGLEFWRLEQVMFLIHQTFLSCILLKPKTRRTQCLNTALGRVDPRPCTFVAEISLSTYCTSVISSVSFSHPHKSINFKVLMVLCVYPDGGENNINAKS